ncbi:MAG TPA: hypothetical protein VEY10_12245, partial [Flavisolibacter sp.]|nr:hypothetical protein [Flavisolibacter sp.]
KLQLQINETTDGEASSEFEKTYSEIVNTIGIFIAQEEDEELKKEVVEIFDAETDRQHRAETLLQSFKNYQLAKV